MRSRILPAGLVAACLLLGLRGSADSDSATPLVVAHRGDSANAPENTVAAILGAIGAKADLVEFDVRETADGGLVLFHDEDLKRFTGQKTAFESLGLQKARQLDVGTWFDPKGRRFANERPPTLEEAIQLCRKGDTIALIERKTGPASAYVEVIREAEAEDRVIVQAFDWEFLADFRELAPNIPIGALGSREIDPDRMDQLRKLGPEWVGWNQKDLDREGIDRFHDAGMQVAVWTVNDLARIRQFASWGVDGLITDRPGEAREALQGASAEVQP